MRFLKQCWRRRWIRGCVWTLLLLAAVVAPLWVWSDWKGARQWDEARAMLAREGQPLDLRALASDPIPDAENFCAIPLLKDISLVIDHNAQAGLPGQNRMRLRAMWDHFNPRYRLMDWGVDMPIMAIGQRADLEKWAEWFREGHRPTTISEGKEWLRIKDSYASTGNPARDVLREFSTSDPVFKELAGALDRPKAQWTPALKTRSLPPDPDSIPTRYLSAVRLAEYGLPLRCAAAAQAGDVTQAHECAQIIARFTDACLDDPILCGLTEAESEANYLVNATWVLCDTQTGNAEDFRQLESALAGMDFAALRGAR